MDGSAAAEMKSCKPHVLMILSELFLAIYMALLQVTLDPSRGLSSVVIVVYGSTVATAVISSLAFYLERGRRPKLSSRIVLWALLLGTLQVPLGQLMMTASLRYVTATFQSVALNMIPVVVFVLAVACRREIFRFMGVYGQAKLWGVLVSAGGAIFMVFASKTKDPSSEKRRPVHSLWILGCSMNAVGVLAVSAGNVLVEKVAAEYPAILTLTAMIDAFGTLGTAVIAAFMERNPSAWNISWSKSLQLFTILYGGVVVTGLSFLIHMWCIHKKGPVFTTAFFPLLIVFSFILETIIEGRVVRIESITGALLVVGGLYLLLWAKSKDKNSKTTIKGGKGLLAEDLSADSPLLSEA